MSSWSTCSGGLWQLSTVQFDFNLPARFELEYVGEDGERHQPVMVHRALFGSVERFFGVLIEHYAGAFPLWLAPVQVGLVPISERHVGYAQKVEAELKAAGLRVETDDRNEKMNAKIRDFANQKTPYILVFGDKEEAAGSVSVRTRGKGRPGLACRWPTSSLKRKRWLRPSRSSCNISPMKKTPGLKTGTWSTRLTVAFWTQELLGDSPENTQPYSPWSLASVPRRLPVVATMILPAQQLACLRIDFDAFSIRPVPVFHVHLVAHCAQRGDGLR